MLRSYIGLTVTSNLYRRRYGMPAIGTGISPKGYIDIKVVAEKLGVCKTTAWALVKVRPDFPRRRKFGARTTRWREDEIDAWLEKRIREIEEEATSGGA